jgi:hypothetical protein
MLKLAAVLCMSAAFKSKGQSTGLCGHVNDMLKQLRETCRWQQSQ